MRVNPKVRRILMYTIMPVAFMVIGYLLLFICGNGLLDMIRAQANMAMTKGAPDYPNGFDESLYKQTVEDGNVESWSEVPLPSLGTSYGVISCDKLDIKADVYYGDDDTSLEAGVGQYSASALFGCGKPILIGGHDTTYFSGLKKVKQGDVFEVRTNYGHYTYEVEKTKVARADDATAYDLDKNEEQLILYTCYPFGKVTQNRSKRLFVYCKRTDHEPTIKIQNRESANQSTEAAQQKTEESSGQQQGGGKE